MTAAQRTRPRGTVPVLLIGPEGSPVLLRVEDCMQRAGVEAQRDGAQEAASTLRAATLAFVDLGGGRHSLERMRYVRARRPDLRLIAVFDQVDIQTLAAAGQFGLHGAIRLAEGDDGALEEVRMWAAPHPLSVQKKPAEATSTTRTPRTSRGYVTARHLAYASAANQTLLQGLTAAKDCTFIQVQGRPGAEFGLVARELAALCNLEESGIHDSPHPPRTKPSVLVTRDPARARDSEASRVLLAIEMEEGVAERHAEVCLELAPLGNRPTDVASYVSVWLPMLASCAGRAVTDLFPMSDAVRAALLGYQWPGEFSELISCLQRLAVAGPEGLRLPAGPNSGECSDPFEALVLASAPRVFRAKVDPKVPAHLRSTVLSALGFTEGLPR